MEYTKQCTKCGRTLPLSAFGKHRHCKDGINSECKECNRERGRMYRLIPAGIYTFIKAQSKLRNRVSVNISRQDFIIWHNAQVKKCVYCGIDERDIHKVNDGRNNKADRLTIDRKDNDKGYSLDNMVLACHRCNGVKSDLFSYEDMKEIGQKHIKPIWDKRLLKNNIQL